MLNPTVTTALNEHIDVVLRKSPGMEAEYREQIETYRRMGDTVKKQTLKRDGILLEDKSMQRVANSGITLT